MQVILRAFEKEDIPQVAALEKQLFSDAWSEVLFVSAFHRLDFYGLILEEQSASGSRIIGYLCGNHLFEQAELAVIAVEKTAQNKGYGKKLLDTFLEAMSAFGVTDIFLEVRLSNLAALHLYESRGFVKTRLRTGYYEDGEDAWEMKK
jgi:ribosomal-protein-alanine N-acetyltransferase